MNRHVNAIAGRLSPRPPQRRSMEIGGRAFIQHPAEQPANFVVELRGRHDIVLPENS
jgi:hypothetical protein